MDDLKEVTRVGLEAFVFVDVLQISNNIIKIVLNTELPLVTLSVILQVLLAQAGQVNALGGSDCLQQLCGGLQLVLRSRFHVCQINVKLLISREEQLRELLQRNVGIAIELFGTGMQSNGFVVGCFYAYFVQAVEQIVSINGTLVVTVPLSKNTMQVGAGCVLSSQSTSNIFDLLLVNLTSKTVSQIFSLLRLHSLSETLLNCQLGSLDCLILLWVRSVVALAGIHAESSGYFIVVTSVNLIGPLFTLKLLSAFVCNQHRSLWLLTMSVVELNG